MGHFSAINPLLPGQLSAKINRFIRSGDVVLDIGASFGVFSLFMAHYVGVTGRVYAFEPGEYSFQQLRMNLGLNRIGNRVLPHKMAAGESSGTLRLYHVGDAPVTFSMGASGDSFEEVPANRVDALVPVADHARVSFIKIDVEGFERTALEGARKIIEASKPVIMFEVSADALKRSNMTPTEMYGYLAAYGYEFYWFDAENRLVSIAGTPDGNIIAMPT